MPRNDWENMSDEELMNAAPPPIPSAEERLNDNDNTPDVIEGGSGESTPDVPSDVPADDSGNTPSELEGQDNTNDQTPEEVEEDPSGILGASDDDLESLARAQREKKPEAPADEPAKPAADATKPKEGDKPPEGQAPPEAITAEQAAQYKAVHDAIMKPIKANGKDIQLKSVDEAVQLIQMGANYTKKLQELKPHLRLVKMLQANNLLDETRLSYLIDLDKKDPEAVKKLLKDGNIDPMDVDTSVDHNYKDKSYAPSEAQMTFEETLSDVTTTEHGKKVVVRINKEWDKASKEAIAREPQLLRVITDQQENGLYDVIAAEVDRQKVLGNFQGVPYINAYYQTGMALQAQGIIPGPQAPASGATPEAKPAPVVQPPQERQPIATRTAAPKPDANADRVRSAAPNRTNTTKEVKPVFNPLDMSDEDFAKVDRFGNRL